MCLWQWKRVVVAVEECACDSGSVVKLPHNMVGFL